jgi:hypothetical protein
MAAKKQTRAKIKSLCPDFTGYESWSPQKYHSTRNAMRDYIYGEFKASDLLPIVWKWMKNNEYSAQEIKQAKAAGVNTTVGLYAKMMDMGVPSYYDKHAEYWEGLSGVSGKMRDINEFLKEKVDEAIIVGKDIVVEEKKEEEAKKNVYVPTIQDRIREQAQKSCHAIDEWLDTYVEKKQDFNFVGHFSEMGVTQAHARKIKEYYTAEYEEYNEVVNHMPTPQQIAKIKDEQEKDLAQQFREGYAHLAKADAKKMLEGLEKILTACDMVVEKAKTTRKPRVKKPVAKEKLIAKLKYKKQDDKYSIVSSNPSELIEAKEVWVFNTKTRKLGKYIADDMTGPITVKGTSLVGFDEFKSVQKTLRKPEEQLKEFKKAGKVALRKFLEDIKTTDTKLNGRFNEETVILKVIR